MGDGCQPALLNFLKGNCPLDFPMGAILHLESNGKDACILFWARRNPVYFWGKRGDYWASSQACPLLAFAEYTPLTKERGDSENVSKLHIGKVCAHLVISASFKESHSLKPMRFSSFLYWHLCLTGNLIRLSWLPSSSWSECFCLDLNS